MAGNLTWLGDSDPSQVVISMYGMQFVKGEPVAVKDKAVFERLSNNPMFSSEKNATPADADEPSDEALAAASEAGTAKAALKAQLRTLGITVQGNPSEDTLRERLAKAVAE